MLSPTRSRGPQDILKQKYGATPEQAASLASFMLPMLDFVPERSALHVCLPLLVPPFSPPHPLPPAWFNNFAARSRAHMLLYDVLLRPHRRPTARQLLEHPWLTIVPGESLRGRPWIERPIALEPDLSTTDNPADEDDPPAAASTATAAGGATTGGGLPNDSAFEDEAATAAAGAAGVPPRGSL